MTRLQFERRRMGLSQTDLAARAGRLAASDISKFENGYARPYPAQAERLARALSLSVDQLFSDVSPAVQGETRG